MTDAPTAVIVASGTELLDGRRRDTNVGWLSADLASRGLAVLLALTVADDLAQLISSLRYAVAQHPQLIVCSGGLGTTHDDLTAAALAELAGVELREDPRAVAMVQRVLRPFAEKRQTTVAELLASSRRQTLLPVGSTALAPAGVAPGISLMIDEVRIVALPGVPWELKAMWASYADQAAVELGWRPRAHRLLRFYGCGEPAVAVRLSEVPCAALAVGVTAEGGEITVSLGYDAGDDQAVRQAQALGEHLCRHLPCYDADGRTVDELIAADLVAAEQALAVAESCTGGALAARLVHRPGSSSYFVGGVVSYSNELKRELLGVSGAELDAHGAVSAEVAAAMAEGARRRCGADWGLSVTGVAGPDGGTAEKPVGLVYLGCAGPRGTQVVGERFPGDRGAIRAQSVTRALHLLRKQLHDAE